MSHVVLNVKFLFGRCFPGDHILAAWPEGLEVEVNSFIGGGRDMRMGWCVNECALWGCVPYEGLSLHWSVALVARR